MSPARFVGAAAALALSLCAIGAAGAQPTAEPPVRVGPTAAQWQKVFPVLRQQALKDHQARAAILQRGERCLSAAAAIEALRTCQREERSALMQQHLKHRDAVRALFERNGLPVPEGKGRRGGPGGGHGGDF
jgi:hypothetical protein